MMYELTVYTVAWVVIMPFVAWFVYRGKPTDWLAVLLIWLGVPFVMWVLYSLVGLVRLLAGVGFFW